MNDGLHLKDMEITNNMNIINRWSSSGGKKTAFIH